MLDRHRPRRWEGRAPVKGYGDVLPGRAKKASAALKGPQASWVPFEARTHPTRPTALWGATRRPFPTGPRRRADLVRAFSRRKTRSVTCGA